MFHFHCRSAQGISSTWALGNSRSRRPHNTVSALFGIHGLLICGSEEVGKGSPVCSETIWLRCEHMILATGHWPALALGPHLARQWGSLDVGSAQPPLRCLSSKSCLALSSIQPPSLQQPVYSDCLMRVRGKGPSCLIIPILPSLKNHHSSRASQGGWGREHVLCGPSHPFTTGTDPEIHFPTNFVPANLWGRVCSPGSSTPSILQSSECFLKMQMTGLDPRPAELISRGGGWNPHY